MEKDTSDTRYVEAVRDKQRSAVRFLEAGKDREPTRIKSPDRLAQQFPIQKTTQAADRAREVTSVYRRRAATKTVVSRFAISAIKKLTVAAMTIRIHVSGEESDLLGLVAANGTDEESKSHEFERRGRWQ